MYNTLFEVANPPNVIYQMVQYIKLISYVSLIFSFATDILFKYIYEEDISIFNFTLLLVKLTIGFNLILDYIVSFTQNNKEFTIMLLLYTYFNRIAKSFLYDVPQQQYLLIITIIPLCLLEILHTYICVFLNNDNLVKLRKYLFRVLLPVQLYGDMMCIYYIEHDSWSIYFSLYFYLIIFFLVEMYDNYLVSEKIIIEQKKLKSNTAKKISIMLNKKKV